MRRPVLWLVVGVLPVMLVVANLFCAVVYHVVEAPARRFIVERFG